MKERLREGVMGGGVKRKIRELGCLKIYKIAVGRLVVKPKIKVLPYGNTTRTFAKLNTS